MIDIFGIGINLLGTNYRYFTLLNCSKSWYYTSEFWQLQGIRVKSTWSVHGSVLVECAVVPLVQSSISVHSVHNVVLITTPASDETLPASYTTCKVFILDNYLWTLPKHNLLKSPKIVNILNTNSTYKRKTDKTFMIQWSYWAPMDLYVVLIHVRPRSSFQVGFTMDLNLIKWMIFFRSTYSI